MRRRRNLVKAVAAGLAISFLAATVGVLALSAADDGGDAEDLSDDANELLELLDRRDEATYHAKYEASTPDLERLTLETWQMPDRSRQDSEVRSGTQLVKARVLVSDDQRVRCSQLNNGPWQCRPAGAQEASTDPLASFRARLGDGTVTAKDSSVEGRKVRCFSLTTADGTSELCLAPSTGVPVRVSGGTTQLRLVMLDEAVDEELFLPPATVQQG